MAWRAVSKAGYVLYADDVVKVDSSFSDVFAFGTAGAFRVARQL